MELLPQLVHFASAPVCDNGPKVKENMLVVCVIVKCVLQTAKPPWHVWEAENNFVQIVNSLVTIWKVHSQKLHEALIDKIPAVQWYT